MARNGNGTADTGGMQIYVPRCIVTAKQYVDRFGDRVLPEPYWNFTIMDGLGSEFQFRTSVDLSDIPFEPLSMEAVVRGKTQNIKKEDGFVAETVRLTCESIAFKRLLVGATSAPEGA
jgi:hypothetical protein